MFSQERRKAWPGTGTDASALAATKLKFKRREGGGGDKFLTLNKFEIIKQNKRQFDK